MTHFIHSHREFNNETLLGRSFFIYEALPKAPENAPAGPKAKPAETAGGSVTPLKEDVVAKYESALIKSIGTAQLDDKQEVSPQEQALRDKWTKYSKEKFQEIRTAYKKDLEALNTTKVEKSAKEFTEEMTAFLKKLGARMEEPKVEAQQATQPTPYKEKTEAGTKTIKEFIDKNFDVLVTNEFKLLGNDFFKLLGVDATPPTAEQILKEIKKYPSIQEMCKNSFLQFSQEDLNLLNEGKLQMSDFVKQLTIRMMNNSLLIMRGEIRPEEPKNVEEIITKFKLPGNLSKDFKEQLCQKYKIEKKGDDFTINGKPVTEQSINELEELKEIRTAQAKGDKKGLEDAIGKGEMIAQGQKEAVAAMKGINQILANPEVAKQLAATDSLGALIELWNAIKEAFANHDFTYLKDVLSELSTNPKGLSAKRDKIKNEFDKLLKPPNPAPTLDKLLAVYIDPYAKVADELFPAGPQSFKREAKGVIQTYLGDKLSGLQSITKIEKMTNGHTEMKGYKKLGNDGEITIEFYTNAKGELTADIYKYITPEGATSPKKIQDGKTIEKVTIDSLNNALTGTTPEKAPATVETKEAPFEIVKYVKDSLVNFKPGDLNNLVNKVEFTKLQKAEYKKAKTFNEKVACIAKNITKAQLDVYLGRTMSIQKKLPTAEKTGKGITKKVDQTARQFEKAYKKDKSIDKTKVSKWDYVDDKLRNSPDAGLKDAYTKAFKAPGATEAEAVAKAPEGTATDTSNNKPAGKPADAPAQPAAAPAPGTNSPKASPSATAQTAPTAAAPAKAETVADLMKNPAYMQALNKAIDAIGRSPISLNGEKGYSFNWPHLKTDGTPDTMEFTLKGDSLKVGEKNYKIDFPVPGIKLKTIQLNGTAENGTIDLTANRGSKVSIPMSKLIEAFSLLSKGGRAVHIGLATFNPS